ncbi:MAG: hypothetical protein MUP98_21165, partial [Candidatus Aminicenantes bacterium]|nr:hypothetical protein [Candidatus Aminicenantes bacterium]
NPFPSHQLRDNIIQPPFEPFIHDLSPFSFRKYVKTVLSICLPNVLSKRTTDGTSKKIKNKKLEDCFKSNLWHHDSYLKNFFRETSRLRKR